MAETAGAPAPGWWQAEDGGWHPPKGRELAPRSKAPIILAAIGAAFLVLGLVLAVVSVGKIDSGLDQIDCGSVLAPGEVPAGLGRDAVFAGILNQKECDEKVNSRRGQALLWGGLGAAFLVIAGLSRVNFGGGQRFDDGGELPLPPAV